MMWPVLLAFLVFVVIFTLLAFFVNRWLSSYIQGHIAGRLEAIDEIVNEEKVPEAWLRSHRRRARKLRAAGATDQQLLALSRLARKQCLANIQELIRYAEDVKFTDSEATRHFMLDELRKQERRWQDDREWYALVDFSSQTEASSEA
jgi:lipopolysaccharide export LptBFGC system permease protein LptF